ncbi:irregular chiasm C-roughest protein-like isoform X2 [Mya arenaria]|uniref:irregular chiasm C-roughest protein-like isoform X2 n=1 Tax=Mya arenaria TaxID=6604 RepID=UPI0022E2F4FE|nr:irregular chiasm C-roughest protein-like isoform X2 [Mya arenaria]
MDYISLICKIVYILFCLPSHQCEEPNVPSIIPQFPDNVTIPELDCERCLVGKVGVYMNVECIVLGVSKEDLEMKFKLKKNGQDVPNLTVEGSPLYRALYEYMPSEEDTDHTVTCEATIDGQQPKTVSITLIVLRKPSIPTFTLPESIKEGNHAHIICKTFNARPEPRLYFMYNSTTYNTSNSFSKLKDDKTIDAETELENSFSRYDNTRNLTCCVEFREYDKNTPKMKTNCSTSAIDVLFPPKFLQLEELNRVNDDKGNAILLLQCKSDVSNPVSQIRWDITSNVQYNSTQKKERVHELSGYTMTETLSANLTRRNNGETVSCYIENPKFVEIKVIEAYKLNITYKPFISFSPRSPVNTYVGDSASFLCQCDANPPAKMEWLHTPSNKTSKRTKVSIELNMQFHSTGSHNLTCTARNTIGSAENELLILVKEKSSQPTIPSPRPSSPPSGKDNSSSMLIGIICGCLALTIVLIAFGCAIVSKRRKKTRTREGPDNLGGINHGDACVVQKEERQAAKPQTEEGALIYADLDLPAEGSTRVKPTVNLEARTTYVSIDFSSAK